MSFYEIAKVISNLRSAKVIEDPRQLLLNLASTQIMKQSHYYLFDKDISRDELFQNLLQIADKDPEFVLQVAYYARNKLLIRSTSNFILAFATCYDACKPFCRKYFNHIVKLPNDLIEVGELSQLMRYYLKLEWVGFMDQYFRVIPYNVDCRKLLNFSKMLQKCMSSKFEQFSLHQLAKYCSERRRKRIIYKFQEIVDNTLFKKRYKKRAERMKKQEVERKKMKKKQRKINDRKEAQKIKKKLQKQLVYRKKKDFLKDLERRFLTMKDIIEKCHIKTPKYNVMCLLGCKYPANQQDFQTLFKQDDLQFQQKMCNKRMKLPSIVTWERELSQQNNAKAWDKMLKENNLPYMAMLRNLRNIISGYLSPKAFQILQQYISNPEIVEKNKVSTLQYYKALEVLKEIKNDRALALYQSVNQAISASIKKIPTISGKTHIFVDCTGSMGSTLGNQTTQTAAFLISQLIRMKCEYSEYYVFGGAVNNEPYLRVNFYDEDLCDTIQRCDMARRQVGSTCGMIGQAFLDLLLKPKIFCNNVIVISDMSVFKIFRRDDMDFDSMVNQYIEYVNPNVDIYFLDISGSQFQVNTQCANCHILSGLSEKILEYIALQKTDQIKEVIKFAQNIGKQ